MRTDRAIVVAMAVSWAIAGAVEPHTSNPGQPLSASAVTHAAAMAVLLFAWCRAHASAHNISAPFAAPLAVALVAPIGLPYYAFRGFGFRKGLVLLGWSSLCLLGFLILFGVAAGVSEVLGT